MTSSTTRSVRLALRAAVWALVWAAVAVPAWAVIFTHVTTATTVASHQAVIRPTLDGKIQLRLGAFVPDLRTTSGQVIGVDVDVRKTEADSGAELVKRYAAIAARPEAEQDRVRRAVTDLAISAGVQASLAGLVIPGVWLLLGRTRRRELRRLSPRHVGVAVLAASLVGLVLVAPGRVRPTEPAVAWEGLDSVAGDSAVPEELDAWQIQGGALTEESKRLLESLFDTYDRSKRFYDAVLDRVDDAAPELRQPEEGEQVAVLVSDRHDNIGMDPIVRAVADRAGAEIVLDAGDDTSTGQPWEAFSLDSLNDAFSDYERVFVAGNHDNGPFVSKHLRRLGWTHLDGEATEVSGIRILGADDPRSSGLGTWRDEGELTEAELGDRLADEACRLDDEDERVALVMVHATVQAQPVLDRGCADLVVGGHLHSQIGPDPVEGENGEIGWTYTNGTTGGAAYAVAVGSKLRRDAMFTLVTFADGRPVGIQPITVRTLGLIKVAEYVPLEPAEG